MMHVKRYVACQLYPSTTIMSLKCRNRVCSYSADMVASQTFFLLGSLGEMAAPNPTLSPCHTHMPAHSISPCQTHMPAHSVSMSHTHASTLYVSMSHTHASILYVSMSHTHASTLYVSISHTHASTLYVSMSHTHMPPHSKSLLKPLATNSHQTKIQTVSRQLDHVFVAIEAKYIPQEEKCSI